MIQFSKGRGQNTPMYSFVHRVFSGRSVNLKVLVAVKKKPKKIPLQALRLELVFFIMKSKETTNHLKFKWQ